eukprot:CAMPEP_0180491038 /NCGR_PEP_ID=MMETSP1036_2-20121128/39436_1 /TAXON_ID=632150 /ORGANISM="Azadinium spinosum, Strain 3D9" /LENGTH=145 /DNA_ID=CAMNT_0022499273 /DNA_START=143 /DNA_END=580 /DNA_ORIENTATION=+
MVRPDHLHLVPGFGGGGWAATGTEEAARVPPFYLELLADPAHLLHLLRHRLAHVLHVLPLKIELLLILAQLVDGCLHALHRLAQRVLQLVQSFLLLPHRLPAAAMLMPAVTMIVTVVMALVTAEGPVVSRVVPPVAATATAMMAG